MLRIGKKTTPSLVRRHGFQPRYLATSSSIKKLLAANRGEIATRIMRAGSELGIRTVGIFSAEDRFTQHRYKADESYLIGQGKSPVGAYLDIEGIVQMAKENQVDAIHPGYGFLSENVHFAQACEREGMIFVGPTVQNLTMFSDKTSARQLAIANNVPVVPGTDGPVESLKQAKEFIDSGVGYPVIIKAAMGGGGRGMRVVRREEELEEAFDRCQSEALASFGDATVFIERYVDSPRHIEIQILGDGHGNVVHLFNRDCSVQRRHQKVLETAPAVGLSPEVLYRINLFNVRQEINFIDGRKIIPRRSKHCKSCQVQECGYS